MKRLILFSLVSVLAAAPAAATTVAMVSDENLLRQAELVVRAKVLREVPGPASNGSPRTAWRLRVDEVLSGRIVDPEFTVSVIGGVAKNGMQLKIYGAPVFRPGQETLLFLSRRSDGTFEPLHVMLGAFYEIDTADGRVAVRNLREVSQITLDGTAPRPEPVRDARRFADWISDTARGSVRPADYGVAPNAGTMRAIHDEFTFFMDGSLKMRWSEFDGGGSIGWRMLTAGQAGIPGGGFTQFENAQKAWNNDPGSVIKYTYLGTTGSDGGLDTFDGKNTLKPGDPNNEISGSFSCATGGTLAIGGPWYSNLTSSHNSQTFRRIQGADIVIQNGVECFFNASPNKNKAAEELYGHELGHTLGFGHSSENENEPNATLKNALMFFLVHDDGRGAQLNSDDQGATAVSYGGGAVPPPAAPSGLAGNAITESAALISWNDNATNETNYHVEVNSGSGFADIGTVPANSEAALINGLAAGTSISIRVRAQGTGGFSAYSNTINFNTPVFTPACVQDADTLCVNSNRFKVEMLWRQNGAPNSSPANRAAPGTAFSGLFFFTSADNWEVLIKVINACALNNRYWVFYAATTNVEFTITVTDTQSGQVRQYFNALNNAAAPVQDTGAFTTCP